MFEYIPVKHGCFIPSSLLYIQVYDDEYIYVRDTFTVIYISGYTVYISSREGGYFLNIYSRVSAGSTFRFLRFNVKTFILLQFYVNLSLKDTIEKYFFRIRRGAKCSTFTN